ncbi:MAG: glycosyltransferase family 29 protein [Enhygromyxa sp.]
MSLMKVVVIGNSRDILARDNGAAIDACDLVIRLNSFKTDGVERHVGRRVDVVSICLAPWVVANALVHAAEQIARAPAIWTPSWRGHAEDHEVTAAMATCRRPVSDLVFADDTGHAKLIQDLYAEFHRRAEARPGPKTQAPDGKRLLPTTGFLTVHLARARFPSAALFITGFGLNSPPSPARFDASGVPMWLGHDLPTERAWLFEGAQQGSWKLL